METETAQEIMLDIYTRIVLHSIELRIKEILLLITYKR